MVNRIPDSFIDKLLSRLDIVDVIQSRVRLKKSGTNYSARCPFHQEKTPSFSINANKQFYHCFGCGKSGDAIQFVIEYEHLSFREAVEVLANTVGLELPIEQRISQGTRDKYKKQVNALEAAAIFFENNLRQHPEAAKAVEYLKTRGLTGQVAKLFRIGFAPSGWSNLLDVLQKDFPPEELLSVGLVVQKSEQRFYDRFRDRIIFPIRNKKGSVIGFGGRVFTEGQPKYLNSPETEQFRKSYELYGLYELRQRQGTISSILVVEGYMDVLTLAQHGFYHVVATLGTAVTKYHIQQLYQFSPEIVFCFDGDSAGLKAAWRGMEQVLPYLTEGRRVRFLILPESEDPDTFIRRYGRTSFSKRIDNASHLADFIFSQLMKNTDLDVVEHRAALAHEAMQLFEQLPKGILQEMLYDRLAQVVGLDKTSFMPQGSEKKFVSKKAIIHSRTFPVVKAEQWAVILLLKQPTLAQYIVDITLFEQLTTKSAKLFCELVSILKKQPTIDLGSMKKLLSPGAQQELVSCNMSGITHISSNPDLIQQEFQDVLMQLKQRVYEQEVETLLFKAKTETLGPEDKARLRELLSKREAKI